MQIQLDNVIPVFLETEKIERSQVWAQQLLFPAGGRVQIVAPSGSGKTSLVHFLYGLRHDFKGKVVVGDEDIAGLSAERKAGLRSEKLSIIFQDLRLFPEQTALQNIDVKRLLNPFHPQERIMQMAEELGIQNKMNQPAMQCSYGEQQRIAIIRALMQPFEYLLMDEPFRHLDDANAARASK